MARRSSVFQSGISPRPLEWNRRMRFAPLRQPASFIPRRKTRPLFRLNRFFCGRLRVPSVGLGTSFRAGIGVLFAVLRNSFLHAVPLFLLRRLCRIRRARPRRGTIGSRRGRLGAGETSRKQNQSCNDKAISFHGKSSLSGREHNWPRLKHNDIRRASGEYRRRRAPQSIGAIGRECPAPPCIPEGASPAGPANPVC